jgi:hypothetical protein
MTRQTSSLKHPGSTPPAAQTPGKRGPLLAALGIVALASIGLGAAAYASTETCCSGHDHGQTGPAESATPNASGVVTVTVDGHGFHPSSIQIEKGKATTLEFRRTSDETCARSVVFPELKIEKELPLNQPVTIALPVGAPENLTFQCGMGMFRGSIVAR